MKEYLKYISYVSYAKYLIIVILLIWFWFCLPNPLFNDPTSTIIEDSNGNLLTAKIADDGQWRFPQTDTLPEKFVKAITLFEDEYFFYHPGVNPASIFRALKQNYDKGKIVSGGSTISMQTIRLSRKGQARTVYEKLKEFILTLRMELTYSKDEILSLYASNAPFGGNVVGLETASWRYYGRKPSDLSWAETCALAVLPNAPSLIYPGKNHQKLKEKRDRLLDKLLTKGIIDKETCELAKLEELPGKAYPTPRITPHLMDRIIKDGKKGQRIISTIDVKLQKNVNRIVDYYHGVYKQNEIHNIAAIVLDVETGKVLAYTGNANCINENSGGDVDIITSARSTGSILKPFLYTFMLQDGAILPKTLITDVPTQIAGYSPKNFTRTFDGVVPADEALARSLNIPAVRELQEYGLEKFYHNLQKLKLNTINKPANHYGLSLILGGAEATLWDLSNAYMMMAQTLNAKSDIVKAKYVLSDSLEIEKYDDKIFDQAALWWTFEAMASLNRPLQETGWEEFGSSKKIAWKTGTSFGHRDAWAIGVTPKYVVGIWVGNADGEGRPGVTGVSVAAPVMFKIFKLLDNEKWFEKPTSELKTYEVCKKSGYLASEICPEKEYMLLPKNAEKTSVCPYHKTIHLDSTMQYRVTDNCYAVSDMKTVSWFVLSPIQEWYYKQKNPFFKPLPPFLDACEQETKNNMAVIYPKNNAEIFIPRDLDGTQQKTIFEIAHRNPETTVFWHLDENYIGSTKAIHKMEIYTTSGKHKMTLVDENGETIVWNFEVLEK